MATGILALKSAYDAAAKARKGAPAQADVIAALRGLEFEALTTKVRMARANGHQAIMEIGFGTTKWDESVNMPSVTNVKFYAPECVTPPDGVSGETWVANGMQGSKC
jgi:branched-chain amino acid transport system substrate-binding protein